MKKILFIFAITATIFSSNYKTKNNHSKFSFKIPAVFALSEETSSFFASAWSAMGFVLGYGNRDAYIAYACSGKDPGVGKECDGPAEIGLVRKFTEIAEDAFSQLEITNCDTFPTSGDQEIDLGPAVFTEATQSIPEDWKGGGTKFDRRVEIKAEIATEIINMVIEVSCKYDKTAMVAMNMKVGDHAPGYTRPINVWLGTKDDKTIADIYVSEVNTDTDYVRGAYAFALSIDEKASVYQLWGSAGTQYDSSNKAVDVYNLTGNYKTHEASMRMKRFVASAVTPEGDSGGGYLDVTSLEGISGSNKATVSKSTNFDLLTSKTPEAGETADAQGCMDFDEAETAPSNANACSDLDWSEAPKPVIDSSSEFSPLFAYKTMHKKLKEIPKISE